MKDILIEQSAGDVCCRSLAAKQLGVALALLAGALAPGFVPDAAALSCEQALQNESGYCGSERGVYVLKQGGNALYVRERESGADQPELVLRRARRGGFSESVLMGYGDPIVANGGAFINTVGGIGAFPHMNNNAEAVWKVETPGDEPFVGAWNGLYGATAAGEVRLLAGTGDELDGNVICEWGIEPAPQVGDGGAVVFAAQAAHKPSGQVCDRDGDGQEQQAVTVYSGDSALGSIESVAVDVEAASVTFTLAGSAGPLPDPLPSELFVVLPKNLASGIGNPDTVSPGYLTVPVSSELTRNGASSFSASLSDVSVVADYCESTCSYSLSARRYSGYVYVDPTTANNDATEALFTSARKVVFRGDLTGPERFRAVLVGDAATAGNASDPTKFAPTADLVDAGHPFASSGEFQLRHLDAIAHSGDMVAEDGSMVTNGYLQLMAQPGASFDATRYGSSPPTNDSPYLGLMHVDASGSARLIRTNHDAARVTAPVFAGEGEVMYRVAEAPRDVTILDHYYGAYDELRCYRIQGVLAADGAPTFSGDVPALEAAEFALDGSITINGASADPFRPEGLDACSAMPCGLIAKKGSDGSAPEDWALRATGLYCEDPVTGSFKDDLPITVTASSDLVNYTLGTQGASDMTFTLTTDHVKDPAPDYETRTVYDGQLGLWRQDAGVSQTLASFWQTTPGGFSKIEGIPPHFDGGDDVYAFMAGLETPHYGFAGSEGGNNFQPPGGETAATSLSQQYPCGDDPGNYCQGMYAVIDGTLVEVARNALAAEVFNEEDDTSAVGVSEVDGFEFGRFGSTTIVTDDGTVFFTASRSSTSEPDSADCDPGNQHYGVFAYRDGQVSKVVAVCDVLSDGSVVHGLQLPQPHLRQTAFGNSFLVKGLLDTDADGTDDTVALLGLEAPAAGGAEPGTPVVDYQADRGFSVSVYGQAGRKVALKLRDSDSTGAPLETPRNGWVLTNVEAMDPDRASYLPTDGYFPDGLIAFTAEAGEPNSVMYLTLEFDVAPEDVIALLKDVEGTPNLIEGVEDNGSGGSIITFSIQDNGPYDFDPADSLIFDPVALNVAAAAAIPVPALGGVMFALLTGLIGLVGAALTRRR